MEVFNKSTYSTSGESSDQKLLKKQKFISDIMNGCQELVELDLLIYPVPGFVSIRSLSAEIWHFVSGPFKINGFPYKTIGFLKDFVMKTHKNQWISLKIEGSGHKMSYLCA